MGKIYEKAAPDVIAVMDEAIKRFHPGLKDHGIRIGVIMVEAEEGKPAVTHHGTPCAAKIKLVKMKQRVVTPYDAIIEVDRKRYEEMHAKSRLAMFDHETNHLEFSKLVGGKPETDDDGRPKLHLIPDDWSLTGFAGVVDRHGEFAIERMALETLHDKYGQLLFNFAHTTRSVPRAARQPHPVSA